jgi:hypothetical protein
MIVRIIPLALTLLALGGCIQAPPLAQVQSAGAIPPLPADQARLYVFRNYRASGPPDDPVVYIDGKPAGTIMLGSVFERDVAPGAHIITTDLRHPADAEIASVAVAPGSTTYLAVDDNFVNDDTQASRVVVFSIAPIDPRFARAQAERLPFQPAADHEAALR